MELYFNEEEAIIVLNSVIKTVYANSFYEQALEKASFPYVTFNFEFADQEEGTKSDVEFVLNIWDNKGHNISDLLTISKNMKKKFHKYCYQDSNMSIDFNFTTGNNLPDPEKQIRRRELRFNVRYYNKNE